MDRNLPLKPTIGFLICLCLAIFIYFYYAPMLVRPPINQLFTDNKNNIWALQKDQIVQIKSTENQDLTQYSLEKFGINNHVGQLISLADGSYIINKGGQDYSILRNIGRYLRLAEDEVDTNGSSFNNTSTGSLLKCGQSFNTCQPWGDASLVFTTGWSGLELESGLIIINDTSRHRVLLVNEKGTVLDTLSGFQFPNHTIEDEDNIWIVDTNHWKIVAVNIKDKKLIRINKEIKLADYSGISRRVDWPSIAYLNNKDWWVMINDGGMANPNIYRLNPDNTATQFASQITDASAMLIADNYLYVGQYPENTIWQFDIQTGKGNVINIPALTQLNQQVDANITATMIEMGMIIAGISLLGIALLIFAIKKSKPIEANNTTESYKINVNKKVSKPTVIKKVIWIDKHNFFIKKIKKIKKSFLIFMPVLALCVAIITGTIILLEIKLPTLLINLLFISIFTMVLVSYYTFYLANTILKYNLGVLSGFLLVRIGESKQAIRIIGKDIFYSNNTLFFNGKNIPFQNAQAIFYDKKSFETYINPILQQGQKLSGVKLWLKRLKALEITAVLELLFTISVIVILISSLYFRYNLEL